MTDRPSERAIAAKVLKEYWDLRPANPDLGQDIDAMRRALARFVAAPEALQPGAWMTADGRVIRASTKEEAIAHGGASKSATDVYDIPLYPQFNVDAWDDKLRKLADSWRAITADRYIANADRVYIEGYDKALNTCADELDTARGVKP